MTRKQVINLNETVFSKEVHAAIVVFRSKLTDELEERHMYADDSCRYQVVH